MQKNLELCLRPLEKDSWRNIYNSLVYVRCPGKLEVLKKAGFEVDSRNDGFIGMSFISHLEGLCFYVIAAAHIRNENIFVCRENKVSEVIFKAVDLSSCLYLNQENIDLDLSRYYSYAQNIIKNYEEPFEEAVEIRDITELDGFRKPFWPDEIEVLLIGGAGQQERVFVRAERFGDNCLFGHLVDEPELFEGIHKGDEIDFMLIEREGKSSTVHVVK